jgi:cob(I)alamin adenosyltransferase
MAEKAYYIAMLERGLVQIYTGDGKGKTMAAFGIALRAAGHGNNVLIYQFLKPHSLDTGERKELTSHKFIKVKSLEIDWDMSKSFKDPKTVSTVRDAIHNLLEHLSTLKNQYDILILDEIVYCLSQDLANFEDIKKLIENKDKHVEIIMTGRGATPELIAMADLVTEMRHIKHPYDKGIPARKGIEF